MTTNAHDRSLLFQLTPKQIAGILEEKYLNDAFEANKAEIVRHPLGFIRIPIEVVGSGQTLYLHIWPPGLKLDDGNDIHLHVFYLLSRVLLGSGVTNFTFREEVVDDAAAQGEASSEAYATLLETTTYYAHGQESHQLQHTGKIIRLYVDETGCFPPGSAYFVDQGKFHRTILPENELVVTLIDRWGDDDSIPCRVLVQDGSPDPLTYEPNLVPWDEVFRLIAETASLLIMSEESSERE